MHCEQAEMLLAQLVFDELPADQKQDAMSHISSCSGCSEKLGDLRISMEVAHRLHQRMQQSGGIAWVVIADVPNRYERLLRQEGEAGDMSPVVFARNHGRQRLFLLERLAAP